MALLFMQMRLLLIISLFFAFSVKAEYVPVKLFRMILGSEKIVYGEIVELDSLTYTLKIEQNLTGSTENYIKVQRFYDWPCAWRWTEYEIGQKLFLFLVKFQGSYRTISAGNEGEMPIDSDTVYVHGRSLNSFSEWVPDSTNRKISLRQGLILSQHYTVYGQPYYGHKVRLHDFVQIVQMIRQCFNADYQKYGELQNVVIHCSKTELADAVQYSEIGNWISSELLAIFERQKNPQVDFEGD
jgi:hypothetical protein